MNDFKDIFSAAQQHRTFFENLLKKQTRANQDQNKTEKIGFVANLFGS